MASDESVTTLQSSSMLEGEYEGDDGDGIAVDNYYVDDGCCDSISMHMSQLSMESSHGGDVEFPDDEVAERKEISGMGLSSDSDQESLGDCYPLPATLTQLRWRNQSGGLDQVGVQLQQETHKEYHASKNKANTMRRDRCRLERATALGDYNENKIVWDEEAMVDSSSEEGSGGLVGGSVMIKMRPKGGRRSLCMDLEEVKACRDLGFDLENDRDCTTISSSSSSTVVIIRATTTTCLSISDSTLDTSSCTESPITKWRISSPGDDPRDVKARLRLWAQAVALASTCRHNY